MTNFAKIGLICVPINPFWRHNELAYVLRHAAVKRIVVEAALLESLRPSLLDTPEFEDRFKDVIKTGGENVASIEVEKALYAADPRVQEVAVVGLPRERWGEAVTAVVTVKAGEAIDETTSKFRIGRGKRGSRASTETCGHVFAVARDETLGTQIAHKRAGLEAAIDNSIEPGVEQNGLGGFIEWAWSPCEETRMSVKAAPAATAEPDAGTQVHWDQSQMRTEFANVINVVSTREEFSVLFGMNSTISLAESRRLEVKLSNRIVLTPFAAKRLALLLAERVADYEKRHGALDIGAPG